MTDPADLEAAHRHSSRHREAILASTSCGCFYCLAVFAPAEISIWTDTVAGIGTTALCPRCGIDSVLGSSSGARLDRGFLEHMRAFWFGIPPG